MSKSEGNILTVQELLSDVRGEAIRFALLTAHYRKSLDWSEGLRNQAHIDLNTLYDAVNRARGFDDPADVDASLMDGEVVGALEDDLNTPVALQKLSRLAKQIRHTVDDSDRRRLGDMLVASGSLLGLLRVNVKDWFPILALRAGDADFEKEIDGAIEDRHVARGLGDYETADRIRDRLAEQNVILEDTLEGTKWRYRLDERISK